MTQIPTSPVGRDSYLDTLSKERTIIKKQFIYSILPVLICLSMPLGATAQSLERISGPTHGKSGDTLTFVVEARDSDGNPQAEVEVLFGRSPSDDTSDLGTYSTITRADGRAKTTLILEDDAAGIYRISAWRPDNANLTAIFVVTVDAAPPPRSTITITTTTPLREPTTLSIISGDNQEGVAGSVLADPFVVEVRDEDGDPLSRVTVTFTVTAGRGAMGVVTSRTDSDGQVASVMTLSPEPGINRVWVSVEDLAQMVIFNAVGTAPPSEPTTLSTVSDGEPGGLVDETDLLVVEVLDQDGDPLEGVPVTFTVVGDDGSMRTTTIMTDENGRAEFTLPSGTEPGTYTITASVEGIAETVTFIVVVPLEFDLTLSAGINLIHLPLKVGTIDGMPVRIESVADLYDALGGADALNYLITHDSVTQEWRGYFGEADRGTIADSALADPTGLLADIKTPISVRLGGDVLGMDGTSAVTLISGLNLVGLPLNDPTLTRVSDLLGLEGIEEVITAIVVTDNGEFKVVGRAGDAGDIPIVGGQGFILIVQQEATISIIGDAWDNVP